MLPDTDDEPIVVTVTPTVSDFVNFNLRVAMRRARVLILFGVLWSAVALYAVYAAQMMPQPRPGVSKYLYLIPVLVVPVLAFVMLPAGIYFGARQRWHAAPELRERKEYTFTRDGIRVLGETFEAFTLWSNIATARQGGGQVFLGTLQNQFYLIPLSAFSTEEDTIRFRELVSAQVGDCHL